MPRLQYLVTIDTDPRYPWKDQQPRDLGKVCSEAICDSLVWKDGVLAAEIQIYQPEPPTLRALCRRLLRLE